MIVYVIRRILLMIPTLAAVSVLIFFVLRVMPGDIVQAKMLADGVPVSSEALEAERVRLGLDKPLPAQFGDWMTGLARLDLGVSMWTGRPVVDEITTRFAVTLQVAVMATIIAVLIAVPLGTVSALRRGTWVDYVVRLITLGGLALPSFWVGMLILLALLRWANWLPPISYVSPLEDPWGSFTQLIWPALVVGYRFASVLARLIRSSLLDVLNEDYIRTARAKGVSEKTVISLHALGNALLPAITVVGLEFAFLIGGLVVTEQVFNLNGVGKLFVNAVQHHDFTMIQGLVLMFATVFLVANLVVDLVYAAIDPRIRYA